MTKFLKIISTLIRIDYLKEEIFGGNLIKRMVSSNLNRNKTPLNPQN